MIDDSYKSLLKLAKGYSIDMRSRIRSFNKNTDTVAISSEPDINFQMEDMKIGDSPVVSK